MLNSKYSKVLTIILILAIVVIVGLLIFVGIDWYKAYSTAKDTQNSLGQFNSYIENQNNGQSDDGIANSDNINRIPDSDNNIIEEPGNNIVEEPSDNTNNSGGLTYKGMKVAGVRLIVHGLRIRW